MMNERLLNEIRARKAEINARRKEIYARKKELRAAAGGAAGEALQAIQTELETISDEVERLEEELMAKEQEEEAVQARISQARQLGESGGQGAQRRAPDNAKQERGRLLKEGRAVTIASGDLAMAEAVKPGIKEATGQVSSLLDAVAPFHIPGAESYKVSFLGEVPEGDYTAEAAAYAVTDPDFGFAEVKKAKITAYTEVSEEALKLADGAFESKVVDSVTKSLRKKLARQILVGAGATNSLCGIFATYENGMKAIPAATDISLTAIDDKTLDTIIYSFGGDEEAGGEAVLILSKADLRAFAMLRDAQKRKLHDIQNKGGYGTIDGVPYIINSACKPLATAAEGEYAMAYGVPANYELGLFSDLRVEKSTDYKFKEGMVAFRGSVLAGGNVNAWKGFVRVKKGAAA